MPTNDAERKPFDNSTKESSLVSGLAAVHRFYEDRKRAEREAEQEQREAQREAREQCALQRKLRKC